MRGMKGGCGRGCRCCHRYRLGCKLLLAVVAAVVVIAAAAARPVVGAAVAGRMLLRLLLLLLLLLVVVRRTSSESLTAASSASSAVTIPITTPSQMRTKFLKKFHLKIKVQKIVHEFVQFLKSDELT